MDPQRRANRFVQVPIPLDLVDSWTEAERPNDQLIQSREPAPGSPPSITSGLSHLSIHDLATPDSQSSYNYILVNAPAHVQPAPLATFAGSSAESTGSQKSGYDRQSISRDYPGLLHQESQDDMQVQIEERNQLHSLHTSSRESKESGRDNTIGGNCHEAIIGDEKITDTLELTTRATGDTKFCSPTSNQAIRDTPSQAYHSGGFGRGDPHSQPHGNDGHPTIDLSASGGGGGDGEDEEMRDSPDPGRRGGLAGGPSQDKVFMCPFPMRFPEKYSNQGSPKSCFTLQNVNHLKEHLCIRHAKDIGEEGEKKLRATHSKDKNPEVPPPGATNEAQWDFIWRYTFPDDPDNAQGFAYNWHASAPHFVVGVPGRARGGADYTKHPGNAGLHMPQIVQRVRESLFLTQPGKQGSRLEMLAEAFADKIVSKVLNFLFDLQCDTCLGRVQSSDFERKCALNAIEVIDCLDRSELGPEHILKCACSEARPRSERDSGVDMASPIPSSSRASLGSDSPQRVPKGLKKPLPASSNMRELLPKPSPQSVPAVEAGSGWTAAGHQSPMRASQYPSSFSIATGTYQSAEPSSHTTMPLYAQPPETTIQGSLSMGPRPQIFDQSQEQRDSNRLVEKDALFD